MKKNKLDTITAIYACLVTLILIALLAIMGKDVYNLRQEGLQALELKKPALVEEIIVALNDDDLTNFEQLTSVFKRYKSLNRLITTRQNEILTINTNQESRFLQYDGKSLVSKILFKEEHLTTTDAMNNPLQLDYVVKLVNNHDLATVIENSLIIILAMLAFNLLLAIISLFVQYVVRKKKKTTSFEIGKKKEPEITPKKDKVTPVHPLVDENWALSLENSKTEDERVTTDFALEPLSSLEDDNEDSLPLPNFDFPNEEEVVPSNFGSLAPVEELEEPNFDWPEEENSKVEVEDKEEDISLNSSNNKELEQYIGGLLENQDNKDDLMVLCFGTQTDEDGFEDEANNFFNENCGADISPTDKGFAVVLNHTTEEQALRITGQFMEKMKRQGYNVICGLSSKNRRLIKSKLLLKEALMAFEQAKDNPENKALVFEPNMANYRHLFYIHS